MLIGRHGHRHTPDVARAAFASVAELTHADTFGGDPLWGISVHVKERMSKNGLLGTTECRTFLSGTTQHRDRQMLSCSRADEVDVQVAIEVSLGQGASVREPPPRSRFAKDSRLLQHCEPVPPPSSDATGVAPHLRRDGCTGEKYSAMAEEAELMGPRKRVLDEGVGPGAGGGDQTQADDRRPYGQFLGPPPEVRVPAAPMHNKPLIRNRLAPAHAVNTVEHLWHGSDCGGNEDESRYNEFEHRPGPVVGGRDKS